MLQQGWVIANHILVSFHVAFISSVLALPAAGMSKREVLRFIFISPETLISALFVYLCFHTAIAVHELGHFITAARLEALSDAILPDVKRQLARPLPARLAFYLGMFLRIPYGSARGVKREGLNYYPDAPYNLAVAAAGPRASRKLAWLMLPPAIALIAFGLMRHQTVALYAGRLLLGLGVVGLLDFLQADPGKYAAYREQEQRARDKAGTVEQITGWLERAPEMKQHMLAERIQRMTHPKLGPVTAPWQFRNCGMGGRHTEKEYPESNISMQEAMFLILRARDYLDAQEITVRLQNRLKEIIEGEEGCRVMGIGLEGGLAPYIDKGSFRLPELRLWSMMKRAIEECGLQPGGDVAIALDPALSELEIAYRREHNMPDSVGTYLFWRDKSNTVLDRDGVLEIYREALRDHQIPILSIEDGYSEDDHQGWKKLLAELGDRLFIIGDDLVTTNDKTIEHAADAGLINCALIKANQIGTLYETILAMLVALGKGLEIVVSHRSKSPNDDMEAQIALSVNALGLKAGGGANTERLVKYQSVAVQMLKVAETEPRDELSEGEKAVVRKIRGYEEPTNAGIPTVGVTVEVALPGAGVAMSFKGATPLGTSAGTGEAIHLVDSLAEYAEHHEQIDRFPALFDAVEPGVYAFKKEVDEARIEQAADEGSSALFSRAQRYGGKGCLNAADNVVQIIAPHFEGRNAATLGLRDIDKALLELERRTATRRGKLADDAEQQERIAVMQRKANLGMNAVLSVSLALARAVAHVHGKELYELLREEMLRLIDRLAIRRGVTIDGSRFEDYVAALRQVAEAVAADGGTLHAELRELTGLYGGPEAPVSRTSSGGVARAQPSRPTAADDVALGGPEPVAAKPARRAAGRSKTGDDGAEGKRGKRGKRDQGGKRGKRDQGDESDAGDGRDTRPNASKPAPAKQPAAPRTAKALSVRPPPAQEEAIGRISRALYRGHLGEGGIKPKQALLTYVEAKRELAEKLGRFGIVNNRFFVGRERLLVPYIAGTSVLVHAVDAAAVTTITTPRYSPGTILTDDHFAELLDDVGRRIDIEKDIFHFEVDSAEPFQIKRIQDLATLLQRANACTNRNEAVYWLRCLVARLCNLSPQTFVGAKNLQPELSQLTRELVSFLNGPLSRRLPALVRVVVRNLPGLIGKPNLIDRLWNDTIDLAEVHIRGSAIVNELRRSTHHALGGRTLTLAEGYLAYLKTGDIGTLPDLGFSAPAQADVEACGRKAPREILERVVRDLKTLLGTAEIVTRLTEWRRAYRASLLRCEFGESLREQLETLVREGIAARNRWVFYHHLRILAGKAQDFTEPAGVAAPLLEVLQMAQGLEPDGAGFDAEGTKKLLERAVDQFEKAVLAAHYEAISGALDKAIDAHQRRAFFDTFMVVRSLRNELQTMRAGRGFTEQRYHLYQLDCLLEEMGYLALRHVATAHVEKGVSLTECVTIIRHCVLNLVHDGLSSRELLDLSSIAADPARTDGERLDALKQIERCYHKIRQRVTLPYEKMRQRLGLDADELQTVLANMQRYMHDLNSMVHFADIASQHLREQLALGKRPATGQAPSLAQAKKQPIIHISHRDAIAARLDNSEGQPNLRDAYGGKGSGLLYISHLNVPTRDGFIIPTVWSRAGVPQRDKRWLRRQLEEHMAILERDLAERDGRERHFGASEAPLVVAVRGGSVFSMPGILSTVVFVGMNDEVTEALAEQGRWSAYDSYRRFLASYAASAWGVDFETFDLVDDAKQRYGVQYKKELPWEAMREIADESKSILRQKGFGKQLDAILADPMEQLSGAVNAVLDSWCADTAKRYRDIKGMSHSWHSAAIVQEMAFGNHKNEPIEEGMDERKASLTGVIPRTYVTDRGSRAFEGEFKFTAAGDDLVSGVTAQDSFRQAGEMRKLMPMLETRLGHIVAKLRRFMGTDQELEFTVERGVLSVLQARMAASRADRATDRFADPGEPATSGLGVRGGAFRGLVAFDEVERQELAAIDLDKRDDVDGVLMVLENPTPEDIPMIISADGLLTAKGGSTSHAAVAVNSIEDRDYSAVMSAIGLEVSSKRHEASIVGGGKVRHRIRKGDVLSIQGTSGEIYIGSRRRQDS